MAYTTRFLSEQQMRVDKFLSQNLTEFSRNTIKKSILEGRLYINNIQILDPDFLLQQGHEIKFDIQSAPLRNINLCTPKAMHLDLIYEDEHLLVVNKAAGVTVHPGAGNYDDTLVNGLIAYLNDNISSVGIEQQRPGIVHRLDRDTTGLLLVAKDDITHAKLSKAIALRQVERKYWALVYGVMEPLSGTIELNMGRCKSNRLKMAVLSKPDGRLSITHYKTLHRYYDDSFSLVECTLQTGRTHQIRLHMAHKKHPIVGDQTYGKSYNHNLSRVPLKHAEKLRNFSRQALHAKHLTFIHPIIGNEITLEAPIPEDFEALLS